jgi:hypothetical protein
MAALAAAPSWDLLFLLPHVNIARPSPFDAGVVRLVAGNDPTLAGLRATPPNETGRRMLAAFSGQFGEGYTPGCLIVDSNAPRQTTPPCGHSETPAQLPRCCPYGQSERAEIQQH